jgi:hypothetical protein
VPSNDPCAQHLLELLGTRIEVGTLEVHLVGYSGCRDAALARESICPLASQLHPILSREHQDGVVDGLQAT